MRFALYPEERRWWSFCDYAHVLKIMGQLGAPARVLEFGPGSSTLALIEGGARHIHTCEDDAHWAQHYEQSLVTEHAPRVSLVKYTWREEIVIPAIDYIKFDLALIDGPKVTHRRPAVIRYAMARANAVLVPVENHGMSTLHSPLYDFCRAQAGDEWTHSYEDTGPLSGGFALLRRRS